MKPSPPPGLPDRYRCLRLLGRGGFGSVWAMHDETLERTVAVKVLEGVLDDEAGARFLREARVTAELRHPHVVAVLDFGRTEAGACWIAYELVEGSSLESRGGSSVSTEDLIRWGTQLAEALQTAHQAGIIHRDVKPDNVMIRGPDAVLLDFGVARDATEKLTATGMILGTPAFMAPELWEGTPASPASDQWALGATLWTIATGVPVYGSGEVRDILNTVTRDGWSGPTTKPRNDPQLTAVLRRALAKDPEERFPDLAAMARALGRSESSVLAYPESPPAAATTRVVGAPPSREAPRSAAAPPFPLRRALLATGLAGALALGFVLLQDRDVPRPAPTLAATPAAPASPALERLLGRARLIRETLAPEEPMQEGSASFQPAGLRISLERLSDRRLPQRYRGLLVILEDLFERGEAIPQFHALKLSLSLERFLERLQRQANPEAVPERLERMRSHPALVKNHEEVVGLTQEFLAAHTPPSGAPTSHLLVATALTNGTHHEDTTPHVDLFRATEAALTRGDDSALWVERVEVLRGAIGSRIRRLPPPCDELLQLVGDLHDQLVDERFPGPDIPDAARRFHLDLTLTAWRTRRLGSCPPGPTWEVAARLASSLERRGGIRPGSDLSHIRRALERLPTFRPDPDEETELRTWSALVTDLERVYWRAQGPRGDFLQAAYRLVRLLRPAGYEDDPDHRDDLEQVPPLQVISRIRSIDPEIPDAVAAYLRHRERAQEAGLLSDEDRHAVFEAVDNLLRFFDAGLARRVLLTGSHPLTYQRGFSSNSDAILDHLRNAALTWKPRDGFDHAAILRVHERAPPREVPILVGAVEEALATAPDAGPPAAWITLGSALVDLVTSKRLPTKISCEVLEAWLERRLQQARTLPPQQGRRASRAASQVATARWFLATEGRSCDPAASLRRAAAATREATRWSTALPSRDRLDWFRLLEEVEEWEPEADTPPELSEARNDLLAALHGLFRAVAGG